PKDLFAAFRATFEEAADADLLLHVVDASDPARGDHIRTTEEVLEELELSDIPRVVVYNKVELLEPMSRMLLQRTNPDALLVTATERETTRPVIERIASELAERWDESAHGPALTPSAPPVAAAEEGAEASQAQDFEPETTTLEGMLRAAGHRTATRQRRPSA